ncbi:aspartyl/asparaginyl beta-hydroxylase domain-containing protein [Coralloluteibacterium stylophorae]|uniref:Aspartyl/asparaginyl beta-hydroxylase domain-containing protein n=1 Tax=Coralloluteibacterium stylophorae TaxID=1776034 RepID=A0A8J7VRM7_9GAMM|nr:aspartyl/asparaginyl beta-hydroxylase domain-containing protein [Coralloluteibacterium stylophorae]MBS7456657.1 aspartyl/asparaginyl beta-hydroxylase domain-containing protein [Coralloluteibacterium stylophorae]
MSLSTPSLDKDILIGGCNRLPILIDYLRLIAEVQALPTDFWGSRGGRVGVHRAAEAVFLRGYAPAEGDKPIEDRPALEHTPYIRHLIKEVVPARAQRCLLAKLHAGARIPLHMDRGNYFRATIRVHFPVQTDPSVIMYARGHAYTMRPGEVWALNNSNLHAVLNDWDQPRTHLICDFLPDPALLDLLGRGERDLGRTAHELDDRVRAPHQA